MSFLNWLSPIASVGSWLTNTIFGGVNRSSERQRFDWEREQHDIMMQREDTSIQRRVNDLKAAGLSPVLAAGQGAQTHQPVATHAPQMREIGDLGQALMGLMTQQANISATASQIALNEEEIAQKRHNRDMDRARLGIDMRRVNQESERIRHDLTRIGLDSQRVENDISRVQQNQQQINQDMMRIINDRERIQLERERNAVLNILAQAQTEHVSETTTTERLRQLGIPLDLAHRLLEHEALAYDFMLSRNLGYRTRDNLTMFDRLNVMRGSATESAEGYASSLVRQAYADIFRNFDTIGQNVSRIKQRR